MAIRTIIVVSLSFFAMTSMAWASDPKHPLDPLTWSEHWQVLRILADADRIDGDSRFTRLALRPPDKNKVWAWKPGDTITRAAEVIVINDGKVFEGIVDLDGNHVTGWEEIGGVEPRFLEEEFDSGLIEDLKQNEEFLAALKSRGVTLPQYIDCVVLPRGYYAEKKYEGKRIGIVRCADPSDVRNTWSRMIEGLVVIVDVETEAILEISEDEVIPVPKTAAEYDMSVAGTLRRFRAPIEINQPLGPGFKIEGQRVRWDNWRFHVRSDHRVGLILSTVAWKDGDTERPVLYEGHLSELFVPYQAPYENWYVATYLDVGEYSEGGFSVSLEPGVHCPKTAVFLNSIVTTDSGKPADKPRTACLFETVSGDVNWLHGSEGRPKRQLVVRMAALLDNYDYLFDWIFQSDGSIRISIAATGIVAARMSRESNAAEADTKDYADAKYGRPDAFGRFVDKNIVALNHSHYFNFRFDLDVDGPSNSFEMIKLEQAKFPEEHPRRSMWVARPTIAAREADAKLNMNLDRPVVWRVIHSERKNAHGYPRGYRIAGGMTAHTLLAKDDMPRRRAGFIDHDLWVTPRNVTERYAAGAYPTLSRPDQGLPSWTETNRSIADTDIVAWYTAGMHHVVRAEDWPVMPAVRHHVTLMPFDFFDANPALNTDVKP